MGQKNRREGRFFLSKVCGACTGLIAGKPAPTGFATAAHHCGSGLAREEAISYTEKSQAAANRLSR
jgi:hypothetical protein